MAKTDRDLTAHLMRRAGFGATNDELDGLQQVSYEQLVDDLLHPERFPEVDDTLLRRYYLELNNPDTHGTWQAHWIYRMVNTRRPLQEKIALFWHHVFATSIGKSEHTPSGVAQIETFRRNGLSDLRTIYIDLARDPAMLFWLDNCENHSGEPNENWGRELLELFSMGVGNYTEQDIKEASRAFTGWTFVQPLPLDPYSRYPSDFLYMPDDHDDGEKTFLGHTGRFDGEDIIDIVVAQPGDGEVHFTAPLQLLRGGRAAGAGMEHRAAAGPGSHRNARSDLPGHGRERAGDAADVVPVRLLQGGAVQEGQEPI